MWLVVGFPCRNGRLHCVVSFEAALCAAKTSTTNGRPSESRCQETATSAPRAWAVVSQGRKCLLYPRAMIGQWHR